MKETVCWSEKHQKWTLHHHPSGGVFHGDTPTVARRWREQWEVANAKYLLTRVRP